MKFSLKLKQKGKIYNQTHSTKPKLPIPNRQNCNKKENDGLISPMNTEWKFLPSKPKSTATRSSPVTALILFPRCKLGSAYANQYA